MSSKTKQFFYSGIIFLFVSFSAAGFLFAQETAETPEELTERENGLIEQMSDLDPSASDYQAQLQKIGMELRDVQNRLKAAVKSSGEISSEPALPRASLSAGPPLSESQTVFSQFDGMDNTTLRQLRGDLLSQQKHLDQTIQTLGPQDEALANSLKEQQAELASNLKELNTKLGITATKETPSDEISAALPAAEPAANIPAESFSTGIDSPEAAWPGTEIPSANPLDAGETWYGSDNKYGKILTEINELKKAQETTQKQLSEIMDELQTIETQLKLLSRQAVTDK